MELRERERERERIAVKKDTKIKDRRNNRTVLVM